jgi:hypothetical protein
MIFSENRYTLFPDHALEAALDSGRRQDMAKPSASPKWLPLRAFARLRQTRLWLRLFRDFAPRCDEGASAYGSLVAFS